MISAHGLFSKSYGTFVKPHFRQKVVVGMVKKLCFFPA